MFMFDKYMKKNRMKKKAMENNFTLARKKHKNQKQQRQGNSQPNKFLLKAENNFSKPQSLLPVFVIFELLTQLSFY